MTTFDACAIVEGFDGEHHTEEEILAAWQSLVDSGAVWQLQGYYGRTAHRLIKQGYLQAKKPKIGTYAYRDVGKWRLELMTDGSFLVSSNFRWRRDKRYHFDVDQLESLKDVLPQYVAKALDEFKKGIEE